MVLAELLGMGDELYRTGGNEVDVDYFSLGDVDIYRRVYVDQVIACENGSLERLRDPFSLKDMDRAAAGAFEKAICDESGERKISGFAPYQITFRKADGSSYTLWHLILEVEGAGKDQKLAVMTRDGKIRISDESSGDRLKITSETIAAAALFSAG